MSRNLNLRIAKRRNANIRRRREQASQARLAKLRREIDAEMDAVHGRGNGWGLTLFMMLPSLILAAYFIHSRFLLPLLHK